MLSVSPTIRHLGHRPYDDVLIIQRALQRALIDGEEVDTILVCEHPKTITLGRGANTSNVLLSAEQLAKLDISIFESERGGDVTYHGPGQAVVYPILNLNRYRRDVGWYMRLLEESVIRALAEWGIAATRYLGRTGVWLEPPPHGEQRWRKISSQGVRISRWCTLHGLSLNVRDQTAGFKLLNPCGFTDIDATSMEQLREHSPCPDVAEVGQRVAEHLQQLLAKP